MVMHSILIHSLTVSAVRKRHSVFHNFILTFHRYVMRTAREITEVLLNVLAKLRLI
jgi:hypothetical protein